MSTASTDLDDVLPPPPPDSLAPDAVDEALAALPAPPRTRTRVLGALLASLSCASLFVAFQLRHDALYALASSEPVDVGDARTLDPSIVPHNALVRVRVVPGFADAVRYTRPVWPGERLVFPVAGRTGAPLFVQVDGREPAAGDVVGRAIHFGDAGGRYARVGAFLGAHESTAVTRETWLVVEGATPASVRWVLAPFVLLLALAGANLTLFASLVRRAFGRTPH